MWIAIDEKTGNKIDDTHLPSSLPPLSLREAYIEWLNLGNAKKFSPEVIVSCMDRISEYAVRKKLSTFNIWEYTNFNTFSPVYKRLIDAKLLRVTDRKTYKVFITAGQLYLRFLKEKPFVQKKADTVVTKETEAESVIDPMQPTSATIAPEDVIAWLVTQPNANGTLYLENVVRQYMSALRSAPNKIDITIGSVFNCSTTEELNNLWDKLKDSPNYKQINAKTAGAFSAGMGCLFRYLQHISMQNETSIKEKEVVNEKTTGQIRITANPSFPDA